MTLTRETFFMVKVICCQSSPYALRIIRYFPGMLNDPVISPFVLTVQSVSGTLCNSKMQPLADFDSHAFCMALAPLVGTRFTNAGVIETFLPRE